MDLSADTGLTVFAYAAESGSKSEEEMNLLASWTATPREPPEVESEGAPGERWRGR
jgi:hypothetical protein